MAVENLQGKLDQIVSKEPAQWHQDVIFRSENKAWLKRSQQIALRILTQLDELNLTQKELAESIGVSPQQVNKWVKGKENFGLETISKLEKALDFELISITKPIEKIEYTYSKSISPSKSEYKKLPKYLVLVNGYNSDWDSKEDEDQFYSQAS